MATKFSDHCQIARRDFARRTLTPLGANGIWVYGTCVIPDSSATPYANGQRGYLVLDNGCGRVLPFAEVIALARSLEKAA